MNWNFFLSICFYNKLFLLLEFSEGEIIVSLQYQAEIPPCLGEYAGNEKGKKGL